MKTPESFARTWAGLAPREKMLVAGAGTLVLLALLWWLAVAPALAVLRTAEGEHRTLDAQLAHMRALQQQAQALQGQPKQNHDDSLKALEASVRQRLGASARTAVSGDRVSLTLTGASPDAVATWLAEARVNARALPSEARLTRGTAGGWDGTIVLTLPAR